MSTCLCVVIPAAQEEATIGACLASVLSAGDVAATRLGACVHVVVVLDACTDGTAAVVRTFPTVTAVRTGRRNVGHARRVGADRALRGLGDDAVLASTDADTLVPADWLVGLYDLLATADVVLGTAVPGIGLRRDIEREWYSRHDLREGHPHVHGANLAIRAAAYRRIGGWAPLATGEDVDLADRAVAAGLRVRRSALRPVRTGTRADGRTPHGFATFLRELGHETTVPLACTPTSRSCAARMVPTDVGQDRPVIDQLDVRASPLHGTGVFARVALPAHRTLLDYAGEIITWDQACRDYEAAGTAGHTFYFDLGDGTVIDGGANGNAARFINHGCEPNCETEADGTQVRITTLREIAAGEELLIDYNLMIDDADDPETRALYACACGARSCRGTMLAA